MNNIRREPSPRRYEFVENKILELIMSGELLPGDQLVPERELANQYGVSRPSVRMALSSLAAMGLVKITPRGTYVTLRDIGESMHPVVALMVTHKHALMEFIEFRKILEVNAVQLASARARPEDINQIHHALEQMAHQAREGGDPFEPDVQFHVAIARASHNLFVSDMMSMVSNVAYHDAYAPIRNAVYAPAGEVTAWIDRSRAILAAIRAGDADLAARAMTAYLNRVEELVRQYFEASSSEHRGPCGGGS